MYFCNFVFAFLLLFLLFRIKNFARLSFSLFLSDWVIMPHKITCTSMATWYIFGAYFSVKIILSWLGVLWLRFHRFLNFLEKTKLCYILFYTGKSLELFCLRRYRWQVSHLCLFHDIHDNARIGIFSFILCLRFSIAEKKTASCRNDVKLVHAALAASGVPKE